jgi:phenylacetate-coenzyme A ligase PaaK-like adenylate-forming protein
MPEAVADPRLRPLMTDASRHVELYRRLWGASGAEPDLQRTPLLDKSILRACEPGDRLHDKRRGRARAAELSSGSSGEPMTIFYDRTAGRARRFAFLRALLNCGYRPGQNCLLLTSRRASSSSAITRLHYMNIAESTEVLAKRLNALNPRVLYGPLSTLELLAEHQLKQGVLPEALRLVVSTAEQLTPGRQRTLEQGLGAPVADFYGMTEFGLVAYRSPGRRAYVAARSSLILEYIAVPGEDAVERLVITDLAERTSPLIRYDTCDFVRRDLARSDRPILEFAGRALDCILLPNGERVSPYRIDAALEHLPDLRAFEVVQQQDLSIDVTIDVVAAKADRIRAAAATRLRALLGPATPLRIAAGEIRRIAPGAKYRPIRSLAGNRL